MTAELNPLPTSTETTTNVAGENATPPAATKTATTATAAPQKSAVAPAAKRTPKAMPKSSAPRYSGEIARLRRDRTAYEQELKKLGGVKGRPDPFTSGGPKDLDSETARLQYHQANTSSTATRTTTVHPAAQPPAPKKK